MMRPRVIARHGRQHRRRAAAVLFLAAAIACLAPSAAAAEPATRIVELGRQTPVREYAGWLLFSRWDGARYHLATFHDGDIRDLAVPTRRTPFDADAGPDSHGRPSAVVSLCGGSCDLHVIGFDPGDRLRAVRNANTGHDEIAPSVWRGRLVFGRRYGRDHVVAYTKRLDAARSHPSDRLAGLPARRCGAVDAPRCRRIKRVFLTAMDLWGRWVAQSWTYQPDGFPGFRQNEIRLTDADRSDTRQLARMVTGIAGQTYLGPAIANGRVALFRACQVDAGGCAARNSGAIRYRISTGGYELAGASEAWSGWTWSGASAYHVPSAFACSGGDPNVVVPACGIYRTTGLSWHAIAAGHLR